MPSNTLTHADPLTLTLAADVRLTKPDFINDQIWELRMQGGEPPALVLQTTFGLRARWMRIFPRFIRKDKTLSDPAQFHTPPHIHAIYPNYIRLTCAPLSGLDVQIEYWAVSSQVIACRTQLKNASILKEQIRLEWAVLLSPLEDGVGMSPVSSANSCYLTGRSGDLVPVMLLEGCTSPSSGSYPALILDLDLYPGNAQACTWTCAALDQEESSLELARKTLQLDWNRLAARIEMQNMSQKVEIHTGREDWNAVFMLTQTVAAGLFVTGGGILPHPSFVLARQPDHGYSFRGDGSDYSGLWRGQTALDTLFLSSLILPGGAHLAQGLVENLLAIQDETGRIDWRANLAGHMQKNRQLAQPVLAGLAWQVSRYLNDSNAWLAGLYPGLVRFFQAWFRPEMDQDEDGFPEWEHPQQTGLEELPLYNPWQATAQGVEPRWVEAPALAAFLYRECQSLIEIARQIEQPQDLPWLEARLASLRSTLETSWDARAGLYRYRDRQSHQSQEGGLLKSWQGPGKFSLRRTFKTPQRLQLQFAPFEDNTRRLNVRLTGLTAEGEVIEEFGPRRWTWAMQQARATSQNLFKSLTQIEVEGALADDWVSLRRVDHRQEDISLFLPLWAGIPTPAQAKKMVEGILASFFRQPYGAPIFHSEQHPTTPPSLNGVSPLWIHLVGQGLLAYGFRKTAMELVTHTLDAISTSLKRYHSFHEFYDATSGQPVGEPNHLHGLAPSGLFLELIGIQKLDPKEILIRDFNPFPFTVTVKYRGMIIACHSTDTLITFPTGQTARISGPGLHRITLE
jgi:hypothetical protein